MAERLFAALQRRGSQLDTMRGEKGCAGELDLSLVGRRNERRLKLDFDPMGLMAREAEIYCALGLYKIGPHSEIDPLWGRKGKETQRRLGVLHPTDTPVGC